MLVGLAILVLLVAKPWDDGAGGPGVARTSASPVAPVSRAPSPTPAATTAAQALAAALTETCLAPSGWRLATIERSGDLTVRAWRAVEPVSASGPLDPRIEPVLAAATRIVALGYCAPADGGRPAPDAVARLWRLEGASAVPITSLLRRAPTAATPLGALWSPPAAGATRPTWSAAPSGSQPATGSGEPGGAPPVGGPGSTELAWPPGTYVIAVGPAGPADPEDSAWLALTVRETGEP